MKARGLNTIGDRFLRVSLAILIAGCHALAQSAPAATVGPQKGWLVLHGGGTRKDNGAMRRFVSLAGGANASVVVVLTPIDLDVITPEFLTQYKE